ncbi:hypothetical protein SBV1_1740005 [Verrucomicrobia bacterium]|nr:hypothetical protein SBV1_1740005 [Verrucomicrobiota bacterium]
MEDEIAAATGTYDATASLSSSTAWLMQLAAFKGASAPSGVPQLRILLTATNMAVLARPTNAVGFLLQQSASLAAANWVSVTNRASVVGRTGILPPEIP